MAGAIERGQSALERRQQGNHAAAKAPLLFIPWRRPATTGMPFYDNRVVEDHRCILTGAAG